MAETAWYDKLRAVPTVGLRFAPMYSSNSKLLDSLEPLLRSWRHSNLEVTITFDTPTTISLATNDGFRFVINETDVTATFAYSHKLVDRIDADPALVPASITRKSQSELLDLLIVRLSEVLTRLPDINNRVLIRTGLVLSATYQREAPPPGVAALIKYLGRPWTADLEGVVCTLTAPLTQNEFHKDVCHHSINMEVQTAATVDKNPGIQLDWQRYFLKQKSLSSSQRATELKSCIESARAYYETFGIGDLNYV